MEVIIGNIIGSKKRKLSATRRTIQNHLSFYNFHLNSQLKFHFNFL